MSFSIKHAISRYAGLSDVVPLQHVRLPRSCTKLYAVSSYALPSRLLPLLPTLLPRNSNIVYSVCDLIPINLLRAQVRVFGTVQRHDEVHLTTVTYMKIDVIRYYRIKTDVFYPRIIVTYVSNIPS